MALEIPLTSDGAQSFRATINGSTYDLFVSYNSRTEVWYMDISLNAVILAEGIALLGGVDIVQHYAISLDNMYVVNIDNPKEDASASNLGDNVLLVKLTNTEAESIG
mgnify:FL=1